MPIQQQQSRQQPLNWPSQAWSAPWGYEPVREPPPLPNYWSKPVTDEEVWRFWVKDIRKDLGEGATNEEVLKELKKHYHRVLRDILDLEKSEVHRTMKQELDELMAAEKISREDAIRKMIRDNSSSFKDMVEETGDATSEYEVDESL